MLYRSIWIEDRTSRELIFNDQINAVTCPKCKVNTKLEFPFLCTNVKERVAVWYEPYSDPEIDKDIKQYAEHFGPSSFYATAPRIRDWTAFKAKIVELEKLTIMKPPAEPSLDIRQKMRGFINQIKDNLAQMNISKSELPMLAFKDGMAAFQYACAYMKGPLAEGSLYPALVLDFRKLSSDQDPVIAQKDGNQLAMLRVASKDGGFPVLATTAGTKGPKLQPGQLVAWKADKYSSDVAASMGAKDKRSGWVGLIASTLKAELRDGEWITDEKFSS